jgi:hypothetical protein
MFIRFSVPEFFVETEDIAAGGAATSLSARMGDPRPTLRFTQIRSERDGDH